MKSEEQKEMFRFLLVLGIVIVFVVGVYFFTRIFVTEEKDTTTEETPAVGTVNYDIAIVGNMLNKPESKYYVFVYDYESVEAGFYESTNAISKYLYSGKKDLLKIYNVELNNYLNKDYKVKDGEEVNTKAKKIEDFKFGDYTLLKIEKGKVTKYLNSAADIKKELKID